MSRKTRKLIWSAPLVAVLAVAGALAMFVTLGPNSAQAHDLPGPVMNLKAEAISQHEIKISWDAPETGVVTGYRIDVSEDEFTWEALVMDTGDTMTEHTHGDLDAGVTRFYRVFALNAAGAGPSPVGETADSDLYVRGMTMATAAPGQIRSLSAMGVSHEQIDLSWTEPAMLGGGVDRYCIAVANDRAFLLDTTTNTEVAVTDTNCLGTVGSPVSVTDETTLGTLNTSLNGDDNAGGILVLSGKETMYMHKGLDPELTLYYRAYAGNSAGLSGTVTNIASAKTLKRPTPGTPSGLKLVTSTTSGSVDLYWNWPTGQLDIGNTNFEIRQTSNTLRGYTDPVDVTAGDFPIQMTHDADALDTGDFANLIEDAVGTPPVSPTKYIEYQVRVKLTDGTTGGWSRSARIDWPLPERGTAGTDADGLPGVQVPDNDPTSTGGEGSDLSFTSTLNSITLSWTREGDPDSDPNADPALETIPTGFVIDAIKGTGGTDTGAGQKFAFSGLQTNTSYTTESYTHPRLNPGEQWYYRAFPYRSGDQRYGVPITLQAMTMAAVQPDQLECGQITTAGDGPTRIMLSWGMVSNDGGADISGYHVQVAEDTDDNSTLNLPTTGATWSNAPDGAVDADTRTYTYDPKGDDALDAEDVRWFRVIVLNSVITDSDGKISATPDAAPEDGVADTIDLSAVCSKRGATDASGSPGTPDGLVAEPARDAGGIDPNNPVPDSERGVLLLWNKPTDPAGDAVTGYIIQRRTRENSTAAWSDWDDDWAEIDASQTSHTDEAKMTMLDMGEARQYRVSAKSGAGTGMYAMVTYPHAEAQHVPGMPQNVSAMVDADNATTINVMWDAAEPYGSNVTSYMVQSAYEKSDGTRSDWMEVSPAHSGMAMMYADKGLMSGTKYFYRVRAMNANGYGEYSDGMAYAMTGAGALGAPMNVMASHTGLQVTVTWDGGENADKFTVALLTRKDDGSWDIDNAVYDTGVTGSPHMVNMATRPAGTYRVFVAAGTDDEEWSDWAPGTLEYAP